MSIIIDINQVVIPKNKSITTFDSEIVAIASEIYELLEHRGVSKSGSRESV